MCKSDGCPGLMSLITYEEARPWEKVIKEEVLERRMPPWGPVKGFGEFRNDASLSEPEIELIANWVEGGAPQGEDLYKPAPPNFAPKIGSPAPAEPLAIRGRLQLTRDLTAIGIQIRGPLQ